MDTQHLQAFIAIAEFGSFSAAAERLHLTQPAVSKRIAILEEQLGSPLFDRIGRHISLTQAGLSLLPKAKNILQEVAAARRAITDLNGEVRGQLSIATSHHIGLHRLPPYLRDFSKAFPEVKLDLHFLDSEQAYHEVLQGRFDLAVITLAQDDDKHIVTDMIWQDQLRFVAAKIHPLAQAKDLDLADLTPFQAIMPDTNTYTTRLIKKLFDQQQQPLEITMVTNHLDTIKMMLTIGLGWGVLPETMIDDDLTILKVAHAPLTRPLGCIYHRQRSLNNAAREFLRLLKQDIECYSFHKK
jgi:DNA-binding transcriptional LysR family regulator